MPTFYPVLPGERHQRLLGRENSPLRFLAVDRIALAPDDEWRHRWTDRETLLVPLSGRAIVEATVNGEEREFALQRDDVFADAPWAAFFPAATSITVHTRTVLEAVVLSAPAAGAAPATAVTPEMVQVSSVGRGTWERQVRFLLPPDGPSTRLIVGETVNPPGHWSGMPPHKHDEATADESVLEEMYYYRLSPAGGYLIQLFYDRSGWRESHLVTAEGALPITRGYHPTVAAPGTAGYYLWAVAGAEKAYRVTIDPAFAWMR